MSDTVLITGASRGIGRACAEVFAREGMNIIINYNKSKVCALELEKKISDIYPDVNVISICADVSDSLDVKNMFEKVKNMFGGVDILINNAAVAHRSLFQDVTDEERDYIFGVNVYGVFNCTREALPYMIHRKRGRIINISSMWGISGSSCEVHYSASKAAIIGFTRALSKELAPSGILVNCVAPGVIDTEMNDHLSDEDRLSLCEATPLGRIGSPEEVAETVLFLASERAGFITGQVISVDGGFLL